MNVYLAELACYIQASSTSSLAIGTGTKTFVLTADIAFVAGMSVTADAGSGNTMTGTVTGYTKATKTLVLDIASVAGSGTQASWTIGGTATLRYSSGRGYNRPSAAGYYEPRIVQPCNMRRTAFANGTTGGPIEVGYGLLVLNNADGGLDPLIEYGFDGRALTIKLGDERAAYNTFTIVMVGTVEQPEFSYSASGEDGESTVQIRLRDRLEELRRKPVQTAKYAGDNALPAGLEGTADDLKGTPKPKAYGRCYNVNPPQVNTTRFIYQFNDGAGADVDAVYVRAAALAQGADYTDRSDMETNAPSAGQFRVWPGGGYFRLGTEAAGLVTCDILEGATAADRTVGAILERIATGPGELGTEDIDTSDVYELDGDNDAVVGIWLPSEISCLDAMSQVAQSIGAWFGFDRLGTLRMARLAGPAGTAAVTFKSFMRTVSVEADTADILAIERLPTEDPGRGLPIGRAIVRYKRAWTVEPNDLDSTVTDAHKAFVAREFREADSGEDATVQTKHLLATERVFTTLLTEETDASDEATRLRDLYKVRRDRLRLTVKWDATLAAAVDLGTKVDVRLNRFQLDEGKGFVVIGITNKADDDTAALDIWG